MQRQILFIHHNFPAHFGHLAQALAAKGHRIVVMTQQKMENQTAQGVQWVSYQSTRGHARDVHPWVSDFEAQAIKGEACMRAAAKLRDAGFCPDVIMAHPRSGESLFLKQIWPHSRIGICAELFHSNHELDVGFDPEFPVKDPLAAACRQQLGNIHHLLHFEVAHAGISPSHWQADTFPAHFRHKISIAHDGIDTRLFTPNPHAQLLVKSRNGQEIHLSRDAEVITFLAWHLEPSQGYHIFMRALPELLQRRPHAHVLIVGGNDVSQGSRPDKVRYGHVSWKDVYIDEVRHRISDADWRRVHFMGGMPDVQWVPMLQLSTVHVHWSYPRALSAGLLEAMSTGCAIVASDTPPVQESIAQDQTGRLVDFFDVAGLTHEVCALLDDPHARQRLGANARALTQMHHDLHTVCLPRQLAWVEGLCA